MIKILSRGALLALCFSLSLAQATIPPMPGGNLEAVVGDRTLQLPLLRTDMLTFLDGDLATVKLTQTFKNPTQQPLNARYLFPLPADAAVHAMRMYTGDFVVEAQIRKTEQAKAEFQQAKKEGKQAALLTQHRPNVFTQEVANLMPGASVKIELNYAHVVPKRDGIYEFTFPMVVGPRYLPDTQSDLPPAQWNLPTSAPVDPHLEADRVGLQVHLNASVASGTLESPTHPVRILIKGANRQLIVLDSSRTLDNKDFVLRYQLAGPSLSAAVNSYARGSKGVLSLLLEPPAQPGEAELTPREMVFVLDCSGSMNGVPLEASKRFMRQALRNLRPTDHFRILRFSDTATAFSTEPLVASPDNVRNGLDYIETLTSEGGTEMSSGIRAALEPPPIPGALRLVVFLTDGYIGNDIEIVQMIESLRREARLFSFGVGNGVNHYLLQEMARAGRGVSRIVRPEEDAGVIADTLAQRLESAYLTDVRIDWGSTPVRDVSPRVLPDLFAGQSVRVLAAFDQPGTYSAVVHGQVAGRPFEMPLQLELPAEAPESEALRIVWARAQVEDRMIDYLNPIRSQAERDELQKQITQLGLQQGLVTQWTSFVAVAKRVVNPQANAVDADVAVPPVEGVSEMAYAGSFNGKAAPEPEVWAALLLLGSLAWIISRRRVAARNSR